MQSGAYAAGAASCASGCRARDTKSRATKLYPEHLTASEQFQCCHLSFGVAISACEKGGQWEQALRFGEELRESGMTANMISFSAAISACEKGWQWQQALALPHKMREAGMSANVISFSAVISACDKGGQWQHALALPHKMREAGMAANLMSSKVERREARKFDIAF